MANFIVAPSWGQSPYMCLAGPVGIGPLGILWVMSSYTECPAPLWGGCIQKRTVKAQEDVSLSWHWPRVPSCSLAITRLDLTAELGASHLWSCKWPADCPSPSPGCADCSYMLWGGSLGLWGWPPAWLVLPLQWPGCECLRHWGCTLARTPSTRYLCQYWSSCPIIQLKIVIGQAGHPLVTHSIHLGHCQDIGKGIIVYIDINGWSIKVFVEFLDYSPFGGEKLNLWAG